MPLDGYINLDGSKGDVIYPLAVDGEASEIRASHVLEHFPHREVPAVVRDWVRALTPGGILRLAVPDFERIARGYLAGMPIPTEGYVMGGQVNERDYHKAIFDEDSLRDLMRACGLRSITRWESDVQDCASLPISLNLEGIKVEPLTMGDVQALNAGIALSVPRLGFMDNFFSVYQAFGRWRVPMRKYTGAYWGQCLERCMEAWIEDGKDWIITIDYDSVFTPEAASDLMELMRDLLDTDAIAGLQVHRTKPTPLMTIRGPDGNLTDQVPRDRFHGELTPVDSAHFGLTAIRTSALVRVPKPWFHSVPSESGDWGDGRQDDDVHFWRKWRAAGRNLELACHVVVGHAELMIRWPDKDFRAMYQHPSEFHELGMPEGVWK